jgi:chromosome segregation ATPase
MSDIGTKNVGSLLPDDIEARLATVQEAISGVEREKLSLESEISLKKNELAIVDSQLEGAKIELSKIVSESTSITNLLREREDKASQKETALDVFSTELEEKEKKLNRYLLIFENMREVVEKINPTKDVLSSK